MFRNKLSRSRDEKNLGQAAVLAWFISLFLGWSVPTLAQNTFSFTAVPVLQGNPPAYWTVLTSANATISIDQSVTLSTSCTTSSSSFSQCALIGSGATMQPDAGISWFDPSQIIYQNMEARFLSSTEVDLGTRYSPLSFFRVTPVEIARNQFSYQWQFAHGFFTRQQDIYEYYGIIQKEEWGTWAAGEAPLPSPGLPQTAADLEGQMAVVVFSMVTNGQAAWFTGVAGATIQDVSFSSITPVPEPEVYAMLVSGLGLLGFASRRRKATQPVAA